MKIYVLYDKHGIHSGRLLGTTLSKELPNNIEVHRGRPETLQSLVRSGHKFDFIVNVGWFKPITGGKVLNTPSAIGLASNKRSARIHFAKNNIPAPELYLSPHEIKEFPVVARTAHHSQGNGFWFCKSAQDAIQASKDKRTLIKRKFRTRRGNTKTKTILKERPGATHYLKFIPNTREFRVHVMSTKADLEKVSKEDYMVLKLSEKIQKGKVTNHIIKNHENGWFFSYPQNRKDPILSKIREIGKKVASSFKLHWGAVDIMVSQDTGKLYVLEVNSSPCLTDTSSNTLDKYVYGVKVLLGLTPGPKRVIKVNNKVQNKAKIAKILKKYGGLNI